jgi:hypothetical protein
MEIRKHAKNPSEYDEGNPFNLYHRGRSIRHKCWLLDHMSLFHMTTIMLSPKRDQVSVTSIVGYSLYIVRADRAHVESSERRDKDEPSLDLKFARTMRIFDYEALTIGIPDDDSDCYDKTRSKH